MVYQWYKVLFQLADGIALDGAVSEIEFCNHIVLVLFVFYQNCPTSCAIIAQQKCA